MKGYGPKKFILEVKHKKKKAQSGVKIHQKVPQFVINSLVCFSSRKRTQINSTDQQLRKLSKSCSKLVTIASFALSFRRDKQIKKPSHL